MVDEMDLLSGLRDAEPVRPRAFEEARTMLRAAMAVEEGVPETRTAARRRARWGTRRTAGFGVAGLVAAAAAAALVVTSASAPRSATPAASGSRPAVTGQAPVATSPLMSLAADVAASPQPKGDATLIERETSYPGKAAIKVWDLYTDAGPYFFSQARAGLPAQVLKNNNQGNGQFGREVAAAKYAVTGDLGTAALRMAWPYGTPVPAWLKAQVKTMSAGGLQIDNYVWEDSQDALIAGSGNPQVRAGVLRLLNALPGISVVSGYVDGQPALTITAGAGELGYAGTDKANPKAQTGPAYQEALSINAHTGIPLKFVGGPAGNAAVTIHYVVTRVDLASIRAGKF
jgi:hypothetical protein